MNFDLYAEKMDEANAILIMQKHNFQATQAAYKKRLEEKRAIWRAELEAEKLGKLSDAEIEHASTVDIWACWERDEQAFEDYQKNKFGTLRFGK